MKIRICACNFAPVCSISAHFIESSTCVVPFKLNLKEVNKIVIKHGHRPISPNARIIIGIWGVCKHSNFNMSINKCWLHTSAKTLRTSLCLSLHLSYNQRQWIRWERGGWSSLHWQHWQQYANVSRPQHYDPLVTLHPCPGKLTIKQR